MPTTLEQEIRELRSRFWSSRDPEGRGFVPLADALRRAGEFDEAAALLTDGLGRLPGFASAHLVASWVYRDRGDLDAAEEACRRVLELDPENARALHGLGQLLARAGRLAAGRELVVRGVEIDPLLEWEEGSVAAISVVDVRELAPRSPDGILGFAPGLGPVVDVDFLAPDPPKPAASGGDDSLRGELHDPWAPPEPESSEPIPVEDLAPAAYGGPVVDIARLAPDPPPPPPETGADEVAAHAEQVLEGRDPDPPDEEPDDGDVTYTRTMMELLARQGLHAQALEVGRYLLRKNPHDETLRDRVRALEVEGPEPASTGPRSPPPLAEAPPEPVEPAEDPDRSVADYLEDLLSWPGDDPEAL